MRTPETHFDQIPLEIVMRTAKRNAPEEKPTHRTIKKIKTNKPKRHRFSSRRNAIGGI